MIRLFYNYYEDRNPVRKREIDFCLQKNLDNKLITTIIIESQEKPTYDFFFKHINRITEPDDINILCNSDIFFDDTIKLVEGIKHKELYALSRWDWFNPDRSVLFDRQDSQDTWIVRGRIENVAGDFSLGLKGCDNRIAYEFDKSGYKVSNPSRSIKTHHVHNSQIRTYSWTNVVPAPYKTVPTSTL
jgi:hypothetical protein